MTATSQQNIYVYLSKYLHPLVFINLSSWIVNIFIYRNPLIALINPIILLLYLIPGIFYMQNNKRRNKGNYNKFNTFILMTAGLVCAMFTYWYIKTPNIIVIDASIALFVISSVMLINRIWWDISFHASIPMCCAALIMPFSITIATTWGVLAVIVGLSRIPLRQHTLSQVAAGWGLGFGLTMLLVEAAARLQ